VGGVIDRGSATDARMVSMRVARSNVMGCVPKKVDLRLPRKGNPNSHGARPGHLIITMIKWIWAGRLAIENSLSSLCGGGD